MMLVQINGRRLAEYKRIYPKLQHFYFGEYWCWKRSHVTVRDRTLSAISQAARALTQEPR